MSIRSQQLEALERLLALTPSSQGDSWKVLVFDKSARDTVALLAPLRKTLWRDHNVTLKMLVDGPRERIADVTAIYIVQPTPANCAIIAKDVAAGLYDSININFALPCPRPVFEKLAKDYVGRVFDQFFSFVCLEQRLFSLNLADSFASYNSARVKDSDVEQALERAAEGLLCAVVTMGRVPIIRCPAGGPAEVVARRLSQHIETLLKERTVFVLESQVVDQRPVLLIVDRGHDLVTPLLHSDTYQALVDDLLGAKLNRVDNVPTDEGARRSFELDPDLDPFMRKFAAASLQEAIREHTEGVKEVDDKVRRMGPAEAGLLDENTASSDLLATVNAVPELLERKRSLAAHGYILRAVFAAIQQRETHKFHELEYKLLQGRQLARAERGGLVALIGDAAKASQDKMRALLVFAMQAMPAKDDLDDLEAKLLASLEGKPDAVDEAKRALAFCRRYISVANGEKVATQQQQHGPAGGLLSSVNWQGALLGVTERLQNVANSVTGSGAWGPCARALDAVVSGAQGEAADADYLFLDPKFRGGECPPHARTKGPAQRCVVFVVGGGCVREADNVKSYAAHARREVVYGCTEMLSPQEFLRQLAA